jgi:hypothetical protein
MTEGPFKSAFDADTQGVLRREIVTYRVNKDGILVKESAYRTYYPNGDYHDSQNTLPLISITSNERQDNE